MKQMRALCALVSFIFIIMGGWLAVKGLVDSTAPAWYFWLGIGGLLFFLANLISLCDTD